MLTELESMQESDEQMWDISLSFDIETRVRESNEIVQKQYTFGYAREWDKWTFVEYLEKRTPNTDKMRDRNWRKARHVMWHDGEAPSIDVPPEVSQELQKATGAENVVIQSP